MPRQDVPYGGAICRLKERIAEIWDELGKKLHSINGVEGDAAGDVKIVSGDAAVVVTSDQVNHEIEIALDSSQLPAASVSSVNGQTGAVVLDAGDIPTVGGDVQADLQDLANNISGNTAAINAEVLARQNADSTLQGNINAVSASIPGAAATAVANDPTVAQLATDVPNKLDKITSGSSLKAYTHIGATQGETSVVDGTTANSIGVRDANGRMQAADPASGATDKTLVTANWVSQTGNGRPNNLLHDTGNESFKGLKYGRASMADRIVTIPQPSDNNNWFLMYTFTFAAATDTLTIYGTLQDSSNAMGIEVCEFLAIIASNQVPYSQGVMTSSIKNGTVAAQTIAFGFDGTHLDVWVKITQYRPKQVIIRNISRYGSPQEPVLTVPTNTSLADYTTYRTYTHNLEVTRS